MTKCASAWRRIVLSAIVSGGIAGFATVAQAQDYSPAIRSAQQQLREGGYYSGSVDGVEGPMTAAAIRRFQHAHHLRETGTLDEQTRHRLGIRWGDRDDVNRPGIGEANRSMSDIHVVPSSATITAAQRRLQREGFYKGNLDGQMGPETRAAIREYQRNSSLNVTGGLDQATLSKLGVSK